MGISIEPLPPIDGQYRQCVLDFVTRLQATGRLRERTVRLPYATKAERYLYDGLVTGRCPICSATSSRRGMRGLRASEQLRRAARCPLQPSIRPIR